MLGGTIPEEPPMEFNFSSFPRNTDSHAMYDALKDGTVTEATITAAARRVLYEMDRFGYLDGRQKHTVTPQNIAANAAAIRKTSDDAAVLLKNADHVLPLHGAKLQRLALIGPGAGQVDAIGTFGERSGGVVSREVGPLEALRQECPSAHITFAVDDDMTGVTIPAALLSHGGQPGMLRASANGQTSVDAQINFTKSNGKPLPANGTQKWTGTLTVPHDGDYWIYLQILGARGQLKVDGREIGRTGATLGGVHGDIQYATQDNAFPTTDGLDNVRRAVQLRSGPHTLEVDTSPDTSNASEQVRLNWTTPDERASDHAAAIAAARNADTAVVFVWTRGRPVFGLPGQQDQLIREVAAVNPNTVVVLNVSQPIAMPWINQVKAVLQMWWPGDEGGWSTADVLLGSVDPAGRLPFTWAKQLKDYPATDPAYPERSSQGVDGKTTYSEGVDVGYRWFDSQHIEPLYPFGYGLTYTTFAFSDLKVASLPDGGLTVSVRIQNTGKEAGDEVPQVYLSAPKNKPDGVQFSPRILAAFDRVTLTPGEAKDVVLHVAPRELEYWSIARNQWVRAADREVLVGDSSQNLPLHAAVP